MFYSMYLSSLCGRRCWPEPMYEPYQTRHGYFCKVRVNNREYGTDVPYKTQELAQESAATKAFMICRNFSANDGMFPGQRPGQAASQGINMVQGLPAPIGQGRGSQNSSVRGGGSASHRNSDSSQYSSLSESSSSSSGGNSPRSYDGVFDHQLPPQALPMPRRSGAQHYQQPQMRMGGRGALPPPMAMNMRMPPTSMAVHGMSVVYDCVCGRAPISQYGRCSNCMPTAWMRH